LRFFHVLQSLCRVGFKTLHPFNIGKVRVDALSSVLRIIVIKSVQKRDIIYRLSVLFYKMEGEKMR
jgi:hypothetical protein